MVFNVGYGFNRSKECISFGFVLLLVFFNVGKKLKVFLYSILMFLDIYMNNCE